MFLHSSVVKTLAFIAPKSVHVESGSERPIRVQGRPREGKQQVNDALLLRIEECRKLPLQALRTKYQKLFGESPRSGHKETP